jgi:hypothetical protein
MQEQVNNNSCVNRLHLDWLIFVYTSQVIFICRKILRHGALGFTSPPKEGAPSIFITLKISLPQPGFNPQTVGSNDKHTNYYTITLYYYN